MLKDLLKKAKNNNNEKILSSIADGYVDIKIYNYNKERTEKKLVYHDTGDNTVTDWMRQTLLRLLSGYPLSKLGYNEFATDADGYTSFNNCVTTLNSSNHGPIINKDGSTIGMSDSHYFDYGTSFKFGNVKNHYVKYDDSEISGLKEYKYPVFPTKVLLGTGVEYPDWDTLAASNDKSSNWFSDMLNNYGDGDESAAQANFDNLCGSNFNKYSATVNYNGNYKGNGTLIKTITVNDPENNYIQNNDTAAEMARVYGVRGAVKTPYLPGLKIKVDDQDIKTKEKYDETFLQPVISDSGRLLKTKYRGSGLPCFIYFDRNYTNGLDWGKQSAKVTLSQDENNSHLNRITFRVVMPSQQSNEYYPYNGYSLKQIGLFNDCILEADDGTASDAGKKMPFGTLLAIKNIATFTKTADQEVIFTWTLTI